MIPTKVRKEVEEFFEIYSIDFKKNNKKIPSYVSLKFEEMEMYDDNNYYDAKKVTDVFFFDDNKKKMEIGFEVEGNMPWNESLDIKWMLKDRLEELYDFEEEDFANDLDGVMIKIEEHV